MRYNTASSRVSLIVSHSSVRPVKELVEVVFATLATVVMGCAVSSVLSKSLVVEEVVKLVIMAMTGSALRYLMVHADAVCKRWGT